MKMTQNYLVLLKAMVDPCNNGKKPVFQIYAMREVFEIQPKNLFKVFKSLGYYNEYVTVLKRDSSNTLM